MNIIPLKTRVFQERENLLSFIEAYMPIIKEKSVIVVTSKIVALAEGRTRIAKDQSEKERLIRKESQWAMRTKYVWLTIRDGMVMANAGIDESNANGKLILLPKDSFKSAAAIRRHLKKKHRLRDIGVIITDSRLLPLRGGVVGVALGYAGLEGLKDYRELKDLFGRPFHFSKADIADSLATAAVLTMGEGDESQPLALIQDAPIKFRRRTSPKELNINIAEDIYQPFFTQLQKPVLQKLLRHRTGPSRRADR